MAANLATSADGSAMIASRNILPWHQQGKLFTEDVTGREMLIKAGLDWSVLEGPVSMKTGILTNKATGWDQATDTPVYSDVLENEKDMVFPGVKGVYRSDTGAPMGIVGEDYRTFQNQSMIDLFENLANGHKIQYEVAGGLGSNAETVWVLARIPDLKLDIGGDEMDQYMLIRNGHIGNMTLAIFATQVRVVCSNTMSAANVEFKNRFKNRTGGKRKMDVNTGYAIRHTSGMDRAVKEVEKAYASLLTDFTVTKEMFEAMMRTPMTDEMKNSFFGFIVDPTKDEADKAKEISKTGQTRQNNKIEMLEKLLASPTNQTPASKDTLWGLYNCAVEYVDFNRSTRNCSDDSDDACRFESAMFGSGKALKDAAFVKAMELVATA